MVAIFRRMVYLISPGYFQTKCVTMIGFMVHEVTIFQERQAMASAKEIFRLVDQKEIYKKNVSFGY